MALLDAAPSPVSNDGASANTPRVEDLRWVTGSYFMALFPVGLFDQAMHPLVSAALEETGRIREAGVARGLRSAASEQIVNWGDDADRELEIQRLKDMHKVVKGMGPDGQRYSALTPEVWNLILVSTIRMYLTAYDAISGRPLTTEESQAAYAYVLENMYSLQLPGRSSLPTEWEDVHAWYEDLIRTKLEATPTLTHALRTVASPERPGFLPVVSQPAWWLVRPLVGRALLLFGLGITHPELRAIQGVKWGWAEQAQFTAATKLIQVAHRVLPRRLTMTPLAYNRWRYEHLIAKYRSIGLKSFEPEPPGGGLDHSRLSRSRGVRK